MAATVPTSEPSSCIAGDTIAWTKSLADYLATAGWSLTYSLHGGSSGTDHYDFAATASGAGFSVNVAPSITQKWKPGPYLLVGYVTKDSDRYTVFQGAFQIQPNPGAALLESSHAQRTLALIESAIEGRIPRGLENYTIDGQSISKIPISDLSRLRDKYAAEVRFEKIQARRAAGLSGNTILTRFTSPR